MSKEPKRGFDITYTWIEEPKEGESNGFFDIDHNRYFYYDMEALVKKYNLTRYFEKISIDFTEMDKDD